MSKSELSALALRHGAKRGPKPKCANCHKQDTEARIVVAAYEIAGGKRQKQIVSRTRSLCGSCTATIYDAIIETLPEDGAS